MATMLPTRILIADDHTLMRQGLRQLCEGLGGFQVVADVENGAQAVAKAHELWPDVILMDLVMPAMDGVVAIREIVSKIPGSRIIALTMYHEEHYMLAAVRAGARGYLLKTVDAAELIAAIKFAQRGDYLIDPIIAARVLSEFHLPVQKAHSVGALTEGELAVLRLVAEGLGNRDVAKMLALSSHTVINRLRTIYEKLSVTNRTQATLYARRQGWVP